MAKDTPGPWVASTSPDYLKVGRKGRPASVVRDAHLRVVAIITRHDEDANVTLIAAAPELLAACQAALALLADPDGDAFDATRVEEQLMDAIAKAVPNA